ncbi:MAG: TonB-dependent receptor plug [Crocinitomicaceae bacterium]|jgi:outer membrane cobalamin receptor|nr:TonB-dependent receptor plug [Crocinitomicaceae bacterium]
MKKLILLFICFTTVFIARSQTIVQGFIEDKRGNPIQFASVSIKDSYDGTIADSIGHYAFSTFETGEKIFVVNCLGYKPYEQAIMLIKDSTVNLNITMKEAINELAAVTITAGSFEANDKKRSAVLKPLDIVTTAGANADISGALQTLPGAQRVGESEGLFIRGGSAEESKIIIDGTVVNKFFFSSVPGIAQRGRFSPFLFSSTAFSTGGYSALYGQALSAVLNLESVDLPERSEAQAGISPIFGFAGFQKVSKSKKISWGTSYSYSNLTLYMKMVPQKQDFFKAPSGHNVDFNFRYKTKKGIIKLYSYYTSNGIGLRSPSLDSTGLKNMFSLSNANFFTNASWKHLFGRNWKWYNVASFSYNDDKIKNELQNSNNERVPVTGITSLDMSSFNIRSFETMSQFRSVLDKKLNALNAIRFGGEVWYNKNKSKYSFYYGDFDVPIDETYSAAFVESDIYLSNRLAFRPGVRYEYSDLSMRSSIAPRLSLSYSVSKPSQFSFDYGIFYQTPDRKYLTQNANFKPMRADHYILTFQHLSEFYTFRSQVYYKDYKNLLKTDPSNQFAVSTDGHGYAKGFELFWRDKKTIKGLDYWVSYSWLDTKREYLNFPIFTQPTFSAEHTGSVVIKKFWLKHMFGINWSFNWATGRPYYNPNKPSSEYLSDRTPFYSSNNFSFNWIKNIKKTTAVFVVGINNVFAQEQIFSYTYSSLPDDNGVYQRDNLTPPAKMSFFVGIFMSWGVDRSQQNINGNL